MLQIYEFSNLLCVIVLVILFFLIKMEGPLPAREATENNEPRGSVRRSELNGNGARRWAGESENHSILQRRNYPTENDEQEHWEMYLAQNCSFYNSYLISVGNIGEHSLSSFFLYWSWKKVSEHSEAESLLCISETLHFSVSSILLLIVVRRFFSAPQTIQKHLRLKDLLVHWSFTR